VAASLGALGSAEIPGRVGDMRLTGPLVEAPRIFGDHEENVEVMVYDSGSRAALQCVAWGYNDKVSESGDLLATLCIGDVVDAEVGVSLSKSGKLAVRVYRLVQG
jgi:hypothetical protein